MKKQIMYLILGILLIGIISAIYPGETISVNNTIGRIDLNYTILNNSTVVKGLSFNITPNEINITFPINLPPITFTILLFYNETEQTVGVSGSSGGSSGGEHHSLYVHNPIINETNITVCSPNEEECTNNGIYVCDSNGRGWTLKISCSDGCDGKKCKEITIAEENNTPIKVKAPKGNLLIMGIIGAVIILSLFIFWIVKKSKESETTYYDTNE